MAKLIFSLNSSKLDGREYGRVRIRAQVDTFGNVVVSLKRMVGVASAYPKGGTSAQPVKKMNTSLKVGDI